MKKHCFNVYVNADLIEGREVAKEFLIRALQNFRHNYQAYFEVIFVETFDDQEDKEKINLPFLTKI